MDLWRSLSGMTQVDLTSADPPSALQAINHAGIEIYQVRQMGDLTLRFSIDRSDYRRLRNLSQKRGERLALSRRLGLYWSFRRLLRRPVLLLGIAVIFLLTLYLPSRVLFIEVDGNVSIPAELILERAGECGMGFGVSRRTVRSEKMKNALLEAIPQLQWAGINTYGCRAVISVRERTEPETQIDRPEVSSIVALRDGVIREITVRQGNRVCNVGQAVRAGQVLISGYTDCGICIRATAAEGEVYAETERSVTAVLPMEYRRKGEILRQEIKCSVLIGKKQINFCKGSGISHTSCDKMYTVNYITLPGGFQLPIGFVTETLTFYDSQPVDLEPETAEQIVSEYADCLLLGQMIAGQIEKRTCSVSVEDGLCHLRGSYVCSEMIGKTRLEEKLDIYEAD